jgi:hypothetical protein
MTLESQIHQHQADAYRYATLRDDGCKCDTKDEVKIKNVTFQQ